MLVRRTPQHRRRRRILHPSGSAAFRGAVEHEARRVGIVEGRIERIKASQWQASVLRWLKRRWPDKDDAFQAFARGIFEQAGVSPPMPWSDDVGDALLLGHYHLNRGLYV